MKKIICYFSFYFMIIMIGASGLSAHTITDNTGQKIEIISSPARVVSLVPSATEIICALDAGAYLQGVTYHDTHLPCLAGLTIIGGAFTPQFSLINELSPDFLIVPPRLFEEASKQRGTKKYHIFVFDDGASLKKAEDNIKLFGKIFQKEKEAEKVIETNKNYSETIAEKIKKIPSAKRQKVMRLLQTESGLLSAGEDSFQTELINAAGGLSPKLGSGAFVPVSLEQWKNFDPDFVYACGDGKKDLLEFLNQPGWKEIKAVKNKQIHYFPCALTCRAAANSGYFTAWLSSTIYGDEFADLDNLVHEQKILAERPLELNLPYIEKARIVESRVIDFIHRTLLIDFKTPQEIISTAGGARSNIKTVGNSYSPTPTWSVYHKWGFERSREDLLKVLQENPDQVEILFTGADMNNLVVKTASFEDMTVVALVTAGVEGNALRTSKDIGRWYEKPGTINIIVLSNCKLSPRAATRAITTITEAKTAALWDMDIRSVQTPLENPATGTGTDDIIVVSGEGPVVTGSGGHSKMGQLIGEAVYAGVQEALLKQNGKTAVRNIFERLNERGLSTYNLFKSNNCSLGQNDAADFQAEVESVMLSEDARSFMEAAFILSDAHFMGQLSDLKSFEVWGREIAGKIAGQPVKDIETIINDEKISPALSLALNCIATGVKQRKKL